MLRKKKLSAQQHAGHVDHSNRADQLSDSQESEKHRMDWQSQSVEDSNFQQRSHTHSHIQVVHPDLKEIPPHQWLKGAWALPQDSLGNFKILQILQGCHKQGRSHYATWWLTRPLFPSFVGPAKYTAWSQCDSGRGAKIGENLRQCRLRS